MPVTLTLVWSGQVAGSLWQVRVITWPKSRSTWDHERHKARQLKQATSKVLAILESSTLECWLASEVPHRTEPTTNVAEGHWHGDLDVPQALAAEAAELR